MKIIRYVFRSYLKILQAWRPLDGVQADLRKYRIMSECAEYFLDEIQNLVYRTSP